MKRVIIAAGIAALLAPTVHALPKCEIVDQKAETLIPSGDKKAFLRGLNISLAIALNPRSFPIENISTVTPLCSRGKFIASDTEYELFGTQQDSPPRWATSNDRDKAAFLAIAPPPSVALKWHEETKGKTGLSFTEPPLFAITITDGDLRHIYGFYKSEPSDEQLKTKFQAALDGSATRLLTLDLATNKLTVTSSKEDW
jgi:hypothetical protein